MTEYTTQEQTSINFSQSVTRGVVQTIPVAICSLVGVALKELPKLGSDLGAAIPVIPATLSVLVAANTIKNIYSVSSDTSLSDTEKSHEYHVVTAGILGDLAYVASGYAIAVLLPEIALPIIGAGLVYHALTSGEKSSTLNDYLKDYIIGELDAYTTVNI